MRDWIRRRLDAYEGRHERRDEELASCVNRNVDALSDKSARRIYFALLATLNALVWLSVLLFPRDVAHAWVTVTEVSDRIAAILIAIIFGLGMWLTYTVFRMKYPDLEDPPIEKDVMTSFRYSQRATKRWRIWVVSVVGGVLNVLLLIIAEISLR